MPLDEAADRLEARGRETVVISRGWRRHAVGAEPEDVGHPAARARNEAVSARFRGQLLPSGQVARTVEVDREQLHPRTGRSSARFRDRIPEPHELHVGRERTKEQQSERLFRLPQNRDARTVPAQSRHVDRQHLAVAGLLPGPRPLEAQGTVVEAGLGIGRGAVDPLRFASFVVPGLRRVGLEGVDRPIDFGRGGLEDRDFPAHPLPQRLGQLVLLDPQSDSRTHPTRGPLGQIGGRSPGFRGLERDHPVGPGV